MAVYLGSSTLSTASAFQKGVSYVFHGARLELILSENVWLSAKDRCTAGCLKLALYEISMFEELEKKTDEKLISVKGTLHKISRYCHGDNFMLNGLFRSNPEGPVVFCEFHDGQLAMKDPRLDIVEPLCDAKCPCRLDIQGMRASEIASNSEVKLLEMEQLSLLLKRADEHRKVDILLQLMENAIKEENKCKALAYYQLFGNEHSVMYNHQSFQIAMLERQMAVKKYLSLDAIKYEQDDSTIQWLIKIDRISEKMGREYIRYGEELSSMKMVCPNCSIRTSHSVPYY